MELGENLVVTIDRVIRKEYFVVFYLNIDDVYIDTEVEISVYSGLFSSTKNFIYNSTKSLLENDIKIKRNNGL